MSKTFRFGLGLSGLVMLLACGSKPPHKTSLVTDGTETPGGAGAAGASSDGLTGTDLYPTSEGTAGASSTSTDPSGTAGSSGQSTPYRSGRWRRGSGSRLA